MVVAAPSNMQSKKQPPTLRGRSPRSGGWGGCFGDAWLEFVDKQNNDRAGKFSVTAFSMTESQRQQFADDGFFIAERLFDAEEIDLLGKIARADHRHGQEAAS